MQTNDNEYFRSSVTDEWNTPRPLTGQEQADARTQQALRTKRHRTARRAFSLAAPVAVVAVAATLVTAAPAVVAGILCPVCGEENCHFYDGVLGQFLYDQDLTRAETEPGAGDSGLSYQELSIAGEKAPAERSYYLSTADGANVGLASVNTEKYLEDQGIAFSVQRNTYPTYVEAEWGQSSYSWGAVLFYTITAEDRYIPIETTGEPSDDREFVHVELIYLDQGGEPEEQESTFLDDTLMQPYAYTYECRKLDQENLWIRAYSYMDGISAGEILDQTTVFHLPAVPQQLQIGSSMVLSSPDAITLTGSRIQSSELDDFDWYPSFGMGREYPFRQVPDYSRYDLEISVGEDYVTNLSVQFAPYDWNQVQTVWSGLLEEAKTKGHEGFMTSVPLEDVTVNGITYHVYLNFTTNPETGGYDCSTAYFVPDSQPTCQILCPVMELAAENLSDYQGMSLESLDGAEDSDWKEILSQFYPAGQEPEVLPAPTPEPAPEPTPEPTPTPAPAGEETDNSIALSTEFPYTLPDMHLADIGDYAWISSRSWSDYTIEELGAANRVSSLVSPGSGRTVMAVRKAYDTQTDLSGGNAVVTTVEEPYTDTELYAWLDADGTLNWYRDTNGLGIDAYAVIRPDGVSCRYEWTARGPVSYTVYPDRDTAFERYDQNPLLAHSELDSGAFDYDPAETVHDYAKYTVGASYSTPMQLLDDSAFAAFGDTAQYDLNPGGRMYTLYVDSNMHLLSVLYSYGLGVGVVTPEYTVFGVIEDTPDLTPALEAFDRLETADCTMNVNGSTVSLPLYTGIDNHIAVYADGAAITASTPVAQEGGHSASIPDDGAFTPDGPVDITVRY